MFLWAFFIITAIFMTLLWIVELIKSYFQDYYLEIVLIFIIVI